MSHENIDSETRVRRSCCGVTCCDPKCLIAIVVAVAGLGLYFSWPSLPDSTEKTGAAVGTAPQQQPRQSAEQVIVAQVASVEAGESTSLHFEQVVVSDQRLVDLPIESLTALDVVNVDQGVVTDEGLAVLAQLPNLEQLRLRLSPITDAGIVALAGCDKLWLVNLPQSQLSAAGIEALQKLPELKQLRLGSPQLDDDCCASIAELETLRGLHLIGVPVTDAGLQQIATLPHLQSLYLDDSKVTQAGWEWLFEHHPQLHVHVDQQHHDRDPHRHTH
ncbi:leucine-rich repeat domain-containing protein [Allorhodopirellula solitaria]|uniref:Leucine Rich repeats (2 copies) n=1 Tax=Allorhodopirellula solitaria TaxID=2527987 RepID=A0A5C5YHH1_9BACT|nr:hypothetical protein [Allorhodopirellula solitaria]TWT72872.1 Leucine Rich repeats (2 copies) [Allorhodopirellula solitaria]